jgi:group I intron endonuclease
MQTQYIYKITNMLNDKIYIGQSIDKKGRWKQHKYSAKRDEPVQYIHHAMKKYGVENFKFEVIDFAFNQWQADCLEINYIQQYNATDKQFGFNIETGGHHAPMTKETIAKIKQWYVDHPEYVAKLSEKMTGNTFSLGTTHSQEYKDFMSNFMKEYAENNPDFGFQGNEIQFYWDNISPEAKQKRLDNILPQLSEARQQPNSRATGMKLSEKHKQALLEGAKNHVITDEERQRRSLSQMGKKASEETKQLQSVKAKARGLSPKCTTKGTGRFTPEQIATIRNSTKSNRALALEYGVKHSTIGQIKRQEIYT